MSRFEKVVGVVERCSIGARYLALFAHPFTEIDYPATPATEGAPWIIFGDIYRFAAHGAACVHKMQHCRSNSTSLPV